MTFEYINLGVTHWACCWHLSYQQLVSWKILSSSSCASSGKLHCVILVTGLFPFLILNQPAFLFKFTCFHTKEERDAVGQNPKQHVTVSVHKGGFWRDISQGGKFHVSLPGHTANCFGSSKQTWRVCKAVCRTLEADFQKTRLSHSTPSLPTIALWISCICHKLDFFKVQTLLF